MFNKKIKIKLLSFLFALLAIVPNVVVFAQFPELKQTELSVLSQDQKQNNIHGFCLKKTLYFEGHPVFQYQHEKSGAWAIVEKNNDIDKKFEISVRTPPENNKGINHIIEHSVLNGSHEYPYKNMIIELSKYAYSTFLNAFTLPTYTTYPVSTTDEDELESLAKIYTSGVLHPNFLENEKIFKKEGIRYELNKDGKLLANGTVFNEMQRNNDLLAEFIKRIFPNTEGKNLYGGIPEEIITLSHKELCETYKKYYHPSNMLIHLTGDINYEKFFKWLNEDYLKGYEKQNAKPVKYQHQNPKRLKKYETIQYYKPDVNKNMADIVSAYIISSEDYKESVEKLNIISSVINNPNSPRSKFVKEKGYIGLSMTTLSSFFDPVVIIEFSTDNPDLKSQKSTEKTLDEIFNKYPITQVEIDTAFKKEMLEKKIMCETQIYENHVDSSDFIMSFIRFNDPCSAKYFNIDSKENIIGKKKDELSEKNITDVVNKFLLKNKGLITVFTPTDNPKLNPANKIEKKLESLESQKETLTKNFEEQKKWAESPNSLEDAARIKSMFKKLSDITTPTLSCPLKSSSIDSKKYYESVQEIGDLLAFKYIFKINHISEEDRKYFEIFLNSLNFSSTKNYSREELEKIKTDKMIDNHFSFTIYEDKNSKSDEKNAFLVLNVITQKDNIAKANKLLKEQTDNVNFKDKQSLKEYLKCKNAWYESTPKTMLKFIDLVLVPNLYENSFLSGNMTEEDRKNFYKNISDNLDNEEFANILSKKLDSIKDKIFNQNSLYAAGTCASEENMSLAKLSMQDFVKSLNDLKINPNEKIEFTKNQNKSVAFIEPSRSNNEIMCVLDSKELSHDTSFEATCKFVNELFLIPTVREKNGAYGVRIYSDSANNKIWLCSNKDPNIGSTIEIFKQIPQFIKTHNFETDEIESTAKSFLKPLFWRNTLKLLSTQVEDIACRNEDYCDITNKNIKKMKNISEKEIKHHGEILEKLMKNMQVYALCGKLSESDEKFFNTIIK